MTTAAPSDGQDVEPFRRLLGAAFAALPEPVQYLHRGGARRHAGRATVERGSNALSWLMGWLAGLPPAARDATIEVELEAIAGGERWTRRFGGRAMQSRLRAGDDGLLWERLGPATFGFALTADALGITWQATRARAFGLPLPGRWFAGVKAREGIEGTRYTFDVDATLPLVGRVVGYRGWLDIA